MIVEHRKAAHAVDGLHEAEEAGPWGVCDVLLVADRARGGTHRFFHGWRFEAVMRSGRPASGTVLVAAPLAFADADGTGWGYELRLLGDHAESPGSGRATFSWATTDALGAPDPLAEALGRIRAWLDANGWEQDPLNPGRYHG